MFLPYRWFKFTIFQTFYTALYFIKDDLVSHLLDKLCSTNHSGYIFTVLLVIFKRLKQQQVAQGQYVVSDTHCPALLGCELEWEEAGQRPLGFVPGRRDPPWIRVRVRMIFRRGQKPTSSSFIFSHFWKWMFLFFCLLCLKGWSYKNQISLILEIIWQRLISFFNKVSSISRSRDIFSWSCRYTYFQGGMCVTIYWEK